MSATAADAAAAPVPPAPAAPHPASFVDIIQVRRARDLRAAGTYIELSNSLAWLAGRHQMIQAGDKPTDIRTDIDDSARTDVVPSKSEQAPRQKVWKLTL